MDDATDDPSAARPAKSSPWHLVVAAGLVVSEVGILFNVVPLAVVGLVTFVGSVAGIVHEAGYASDPWRLVRWLGGMLFVVGALVVASQVAGAAGATFEALSATDGVVQRGLTIAVTGALLAVVGVGVALRRSLER